jgi:hypothetical protein
MESIEQTFNGSVDLGKRVTAVISRNGDLIKDMWLEVDLNNNTHAVYGVGNALVKQVELEIGGQLIDRQYGEWMNIWSELSVPEGKREVYDDMVGNFNTAATNSDKLDVPLMFWFNRNPGLALPLIALQYHEVKINLDLESGANLTKLSGTDTSLTSLKLWVDYIYLDTDERRRFAQVSHEYLIEQVQFTGDESLSTATGTKRVDLNYNHPVKELIWVTQASESSGGNGRGTDLEACKFNALHGGDTRIKLQLNGHDRFTERRGEYFLNVQPYKHHTHGPRANRAAGPDGQGTQDQAQFIYVYSFALNPEELQPSGTCNFSRIDNATLVLSDYSVGVTTALGGLGGTFSSAVLKVFAVNYNVLRIMSGMGGLAYSN